MSERPTPPAYLLTGPPGGGKSTIIKRVVDQVGREHCGGFYTEEVREHGARTGFRLVTLDGRGGLLAHEGISSPMHIGRYGIDLRYLDTVGVAAVADSLVQKRLVVIDELGPMEAYSAPFRQIVLDALNSTVPLLGTIVFRPHPWLDTIKRHARVKLCVLTVREREEVFQNTLNFTQAMLP